MLHTSEEEIQVACKKFINSLGLDIEHPLIFNVLKMIANEKGFEIIGFNQQLQFRKIDPRGQ